MLKHGKVGDALVGYMLGIQLPIIAYRFGQHVAVYIFIWRCRRETRQDARRGYGIRISQDDSSVDLEDNEGEEEQSGSVEVGPDGKPKEESALPSVRAVATAIFIMALVTQCTSLSFYSKPASQMIALSLLFSPLGVFARWRLSKLNGWRPSCPLGTFTANMLACALSGSFGSLLAGDPGPRERVVLQSIIAGFGGTLSSVAAFITEVLAGVDPILFRFDGIFYAFASVGCAMVIAFVTSGSVDWVDNTTETVHAMSNSTLRSGLNGTGPMNGINNGTRFY
jgi:fluoride ion exporter CrcB/FEX